MGEKNKRQRAVLITGCSSGFGLDTARRLARAGLRVYATMRDLSRSAELREATRGTDTEILRLDVCKPESIRDALRHIADHSAALDVLVSNAGYGIAGFFAELSDEEIRSQFETNFFGPLAVLREALPLLRNSLSPVVIHVSSLSARAALPSVGAYAASKWALEGMTESLRMELAVEGIRVYLVEPGAFRTKAVTSNARFAAASLGAESPYRGISQRLRRLQERHVARLPESIDPVGRTISMIVRRRPRRFRWVVGRFRSPHFWTRRLLPFSWHEALVKHVLFGGGAR